MKLVFDIHKSIAAAAYLSRKWGENLTVLFLIKMLYAADREALVKWHRTITGDAPVSMDNGPVLCRIYNLVKGNARGADMQAWDHVFQAREANAIRIRPEANVEALLDYLSDREIDALDSAFQKVKKVKGKIADWAHKEFPEWENPESASKPIDFKTVLLKEGLSDREATAIVTEIESVQSAKRARSADGATWGHFHLGSRRWPQ